MRRFLRLNSLSIVFLALFLAGVVGQAIAGHLAFNEEQVAHASSQITFWRFVGSSAFGVALMENWQSEYLQFTLYILGTIWLLQRGSPESKPLDAAGREGEDAQKLGEHAEDHSPAWARRSRGLRRFVFSNSLLLVMGTIWLGSWLAQSVTGRILYNADRIEHTQTPISWIDYLGTADFWERTLQNWQSEFLAVGSMAILAVYLRQRGSPESKPVGAPHDSTAVSG